MQVDVCIQYLYVHVTGRSLSAVCTVLFKGRLSAPALGFVALEHRCPDYMSMHSTCCRDACTAKTRGR